MAGESNDEEPFTTDLYLTPDYASDAADPIPPWFYNLLMGPTPAFHTLVMLQWVYSLLDRKSVV